MTFGAGSARRPFRVDPVPRVIDRGEWTATSAGLMQRARALAAFLGDVYGERRIVAAGLIPERVIESSAYYEPDARGLQVRPEGFLAGLDLVRGDDGELKVLEDNTRTPSGLAYAVGARRAVDQALGGAWRRRRDWTPKTPYMGLAGALLMAAGGVMAAMGQGTPVEAPPSSPPLARDQFRVWDAS